MGTISSALILIKQSLNADQAALDTVANNVANANTTGYTQERASFTENTPLTINGVSYGTGATETTSSVRDRVLEERLIQQQQAASASSTRLAALNTIQAVFTPASGSSSSDAGNIGTDITSFFNSFSSLEANPTSGSLRQEVLSSASTLAGDISNAAASLNAQRSALDQEASSSTSQINALTSAIAQLNQQIQSLPASSTGADAGVLEDQRQQDLSQLSQIIGISEVPTEDNGLTITTTSGQLLVSEGTSVSLTTGMSGGVTHFYLGTTDVTSDLTSGGGSLGGYLTARDTDIPNVLASLDQLAYSLTTEVNLTNNSGADMAGDSGNSGYIFNEPTQIAGSATAMSVVMTDPNHIAAAGAGLGTGDDSNAVTMAALKDQKTVNGQTPAGYYSDFVTQLGVTVSNVQTENTAQNASVSQLQSQVNAISGVNLNDEASDMTTFERSYQAASEVFAILNTLMASALNLGVQTAVS